MEQKYKKIYVEWWRIQRSTITGLIILIVVACAVVFGGWYAIKNSWFVSTTQTELPKNAAKIISFEGDVRITRAATRETIIVTKETYAAAGDTIQTQATGKAIIQMIDNSVYTLGPNSSVVIRDNSSIFGGNNVRVSLDDGQLRVRTEEQPENTENVVEMRDSETQIGSQTDASFNADARGAEIRVSRGGVETTVGGNKTQISANEYAAVNPAGVGSKEQLLTPPKPGSPGNMAQLVDSSGTGAGVSFNWSDDSQIPLSSYYLQVARSSYFAADSILVDRSALTSQEFRLGGLPPGTYYWRLKSSSRSGQTSDWSEPWKFSVIRRLPNRTIEAAEWKVEGVGGGVFIVSGKTQPGVQVKIGEKQVFASSDGSFRLQISTQLSEAAVELTDESGNRAGVVVSLRNGRVLRKY